MKPRATGKCAQAFAAAVAVLLLLPAPAPAEQQRSFLSITFTKKSQLRTGFRWIEHQPRLIRNTSLTPLDKEPRFASGANEGARLQRPAAVGSPEAFASSSLPYAAVGKIFFTKRNGEISTCTGAFAGGLDTVLTAAHCVLGMGGEWHSDFIFVLNYGTEEQAVYAVDCVAAPFEWGALEGDAALDYDYAFLRTDRDSEHGSLGIANTIPPSEMMLVGYSNNFLNGRQMLRLAIEAFDDGGDSLGYANNPLSSGSSGTPWIGRSTVYSVTSHFDRERDGVMRGPRFTGLTIELMTYARNGCRRS